MNRLLANMLASAVGIAAVIVEAGEVPAPLRVALIGSTIAVLCRISFWLGRGDAA